MKAYHVHVWGEIFQLSADSLTIGAVAPAVSTEDFIPIGMASKTSQSDSPDQPNG